MFELIFVLFIYFIMMFLVEEKLSMLKKYFFIILKSYSTLSIDMSKFQIHIFKKKYIV